MKGLLGVIVVAIIIGFVLKVQPKEEKKIANLDPTSELVQELKNTKEVYCNPMRRVGWPYDDFMLYGKTISFPVNQNIDIQNKLCALISENGSNQLENIVFISEDRPPYFSGFATLSHKQEPINSPTSTYAVVYNDVYLVSFGLTKMSSGAYQLTIDQVGLLDSADRIDRAEVLNLGENGMQLKISGGDVAGEDFTHYFRIGFNKGAELYFGKIIFQN